MRIFSIMLTLCLTTWAAADQVIYVNNVGGDDRHEGGAPISNSSGLGPVRTINRAMQLVHKGGRIELADTGVPYRETVTIQAGPNSGETFSPLRLVGNGAILDGTLPIEQNEWRAAGDDIFYYQPKQFSFQMLFLDDAPAQRVEAVYQAGGLPKLEPLQWCYDDYKVFFRVEKDRLPWQYNLRAARLQVGITLYDVHDVVIENLVVQGFQLDGINAHDDARRCILRDVIARGNGRSGISIGGSSDVMLHDCLIGDNGAAQLRTEGYSHALVVGGEIIGNTAPPIVQDGGKLEKEEVTITEPGTEAEPAPGEEAPAPGEETPAPGETAPEASEPQPPATQPETPPAEEPAASEPPAAEEPPKSEGAPPAADPFGENPFGDPAAGENPLFQ